MTAWFRPLSALSLIIGFAGCTADPKPAAEAAWTDASPHQSHFVTVNGVRLNYLDWGGTGPAFVLIHGLGDTPHIFDDFAPAFRDSFRVVAYARRGHGESQVAEPYDHATLTEDLRQLLDSLGFARVTLLGWSMGGNEITDFASRYPDRVEKLVYLEAGYDWSDPLILRAWDSLPVALSPDSAALRSLEAFRAWWQTNWFSDAPWTQAIEAQIRQLVEIQPDGSLRYRISDSLNGEFFASLGGFRRDYTRVRAPALGLYSPLFMPPDPRDSVMARRVLDWDRRFFTPYRDASKRRFESEIRNATVLEIPGTSHGSIGVKGTDSLVAVVRRFLTTE